MRFLKNMDYTLKRFVLQRHFLMAHGPNNLRFKVIAEDAIGRAIYKKGDYDHQMTHFLLHHLTLKPGDVVLDIGAKVGWYSVNIAKHFHSKVSIYAFEPDPVNYQLLDENITLNRALNVTPIKAAVSDEVTTATLYKYKNSNIGRHSLLPNDLNKKLQVKTITLNHFVKLRDINIDKIKFIKIDVEGCDYFALHGASNLLAKVPFIFSEFSPKKMRGAGIDPQHYLELMFDNHYTPHELSGDSLIPMSEPVLTDPKLKVTDIYWLK